MKPRTLVMLFVAGGVVLLSVLFAIDLASRKPRLDVNPEQIEGRTPDETAELRRRAEKDLWLANSAQSPFPEAERLQFEGLPYYPFDPNLRLPVRFLASDGTTPADTLTSEGGAQMVTAGTLQFRYLGQDYQLVAYWEEGAAGQKLFIPFRDATTLKETYGGGRYLTLTLGQGPLALDFNQAYHPYCVYNPEYICPVPPRENTLPFAVRAGERLAAAG